MKQLHRVEGKRLLSPFFAEQNGSNRQIEITTDIERLRHHLKIALKENETALKFNIPQGARVIHSVTPTMVLPTALSGAEHPNRFQSNHVNALLVTSFDRGESVMQLATYENYALVALSSGQYGWVLQSHIATEEDMNMNSFSDYQETSYLGGDPLFYRNHGGNSQVLLPGDVVYEKDNTNYVLERDKGNGVYFHEMPKINTGKISTPQEFLNFLYSCSIPYMTAVFDCSGIIKRGFKAMGLTTRKQSAWLSADVATVLNQPMQYIQREDFANLTDGLYLTNYWYPNTTGTLKSEHIAVTTVRNKTPETFSYAFAHRDEQGDIIYPAGIHVATPQMVERTIFDRGNALSVVRLTI